MATVLTLGELLPTGGELHRTGWQAFRRPTWLMTHASDKTLSLGAKPICRARECATRACATATGLTRVRGLIRFQGLEPGSALSLENAKTRRDGCTPCTMAAASPLTMNMLHITSIPGLPRTSRYSWPAGKGKSV